MIGIAFQGLPSESVHWSIKLFAFLATNSINGLTLWAANLWSSGGAEISNRCLAERSAQVHDYVPLEYVLKSWFRGNGFENKPTQHVFQNARENAGHWHRDRFLTLVYQPLTWNCRSPFHHDSNETTHVRVPDPSCAYTGIGFGFAWDEGGGEGAGVFGWGERNTVQWFESQPIKDVGNQLRIMACAVMNNCVHSQYSIYS